MIQKLTSPAMIQILAANDLEARIFSDQPPYKWSGNEKVDIKAIYIIQRHGDPLYLLFGIYGDRGPTISFQHLRMKDRQHIRFFEPRALPGLLLTTRSQLHHLASHLKLPTLDLVNLALKISFDELARLRTAPNF